MNAKSVKTARSSSNKPFALPTRLKTPRTSTASHHSSKSESGSTSSKLSNTSRKRTKQHRPPPAILIGTQACADHRRSTSPPPSSGSSCAVSDTLLASPSSLAFPTMAQNQGRQQNRNSDRFKDKGDAKQYDILADLDDVPDHSRSSDPKLSLFDAARELQRRNISVKGLSLQALLSLQMTSAATPTTPGRAERNPLSRQETHLFPDQLLNMGFDPSIPDIALRTVLNAGATVDFNAVPYGSVSPSTGMQQCTECDSKFTTLDELDEHLAWEDRWCSHCKKRFECRGVFDDHPCAIAIRGGGGGGGGGGLLSGPMLGGGRRKNTG